MRTLCLLVLLAPMLAAVTAGAQPKGPAGAMPPGMPAALPALTRADVEKMVTIIPEVARESGQLTSGAASTGSMGPGGMPQPSERDVQRMQAMLEKHGFEFSEFFMKLTVLVSTYLSLKPEEFDRQLPNEGTPEVKAQLDDPTVSAEQKAAIKSQLKDLQANKETLRAQVTGYATEENKAAVRPLLAKVQKALEAAEAEGKKARERALKNAAKAAPEKPAADKPGPRRQ